MSAEHIPSQPGAQGTPQPELPFTPVYQAPSSVTNLDYRAPVALHPDIAERLAHSHNDIDLATTFETVSSLPLPQVGQAVSAFAQSDNPTRGFMSFAAVTTIQRALRRRTEPGTPLTLTNTEGEALEDAFRSLQRIVPQIRASGHGREFFISRLRDIRDDFPEMRPLTQSLFEKVGRTEAEEAIARLSELSPTTSVGEMQAFLQHHSLRELTETINRYRALNTAMRKLSEPQQGELLTAIGRQPDDDNFQKRLYLLDSIFSTDQGYLAINNLSGYGISLDHLPTLLNNESIFKLIDVMLDNPKQYRFQLGIIFSEITLDNIPERLKTKMKPLAQEMEFSLKPEHNSWWLCPDAERRLQRAMMDDATILVNDAILMKTVGKFSGLSLATFATPEGKVFHEGNWYSPTDSDSRHAIRSAFDEGQARLTLDKGMWALMRPVGGTVPPAEDVLEKAKSYAASMPDTLPEQIYGMTRRAYRERHYEDE